MCRGGIDQVVENSTVTEAFTLTTRSIITGMPPRRPDRSRDVSYTASGAQKDDSYRRCKNVLRDLFWSRFYVFYVLFIFRTFFLFLKNVGKVQSGKQINKKHFQNNSNEKTYDFSAAC